MQYEKVRRQLLGLAFLVCVVGLLVTHCEAQTAFSVEGASPNYEPLPGYFKIQGSYKITGDNLEVKIDKITFGPKMDGSPVTFIVVGAGTPYKPILDKQVFKNKFAGRDGAILVPEKPVSTFSVAKIQENVKERQKDDRQAKPIIWVTVNWEVDGKQWAHLDSVKIPIQGISIPPPN